MSSPSISVAIPCYNDGYYLRRCLQAVAQQSMPPAEVIVVDDGSTDHTPDVCRDLERVLTCPLHYYYQDNAGVSRARNLAVDVLSGEHVIFVDADDELVRGAISAFESVISSTGAKWIVAPRQWERNGKIKRRAVHLPPTREERFALYLSKKLEFHISGACFAKELFDWIAFPEHMRFAEDRVLFALLLATSDPHVIDEPAVLVHPRANSLRSRATLADLIASPVHAEIFDHPLLPPEFQKFEDCWAACNARSICRRAYKEKEWALVVEWYRKMIANRRRYALNPRLTLRYLWAHLRLLAA